MELHTDYSEYVRARVRERENDTEYRYPPSGWVFMEGPVLREHLEAVERQVAEMRRERGLDPEVPLVQPRERIEGGSPVLGAARDQIKGKRKREAEDTTGDNSRGKSVKRAKRGRPAENPQPQTSSSPSPKKPKSATRRCCSRRAKGGGEQGASKRERERKTSRRRAQRFQHAADGQGLVRRETAEEVAHGLAC